MSELAAIVIGTDPDQRTVLQMQLDGTAVAKTVHSFSSFPASASDPIVRRIQDIAPNVVVVDIPKQSSANALRTIEMLRSELPDAAVFAVGDTSQPQVIISAMRAGAKEFLERPTTTSGLLEALARISSAQRKVQSNSQRGKIFTFVNTRGGAGATTIAINVASNLQNAAGRVVMVDLAPLGHAALHLNVRPSFTIADVVRNLQRLDQALLEGYLTSVRGGLQLLAGVTDPHQEEFSTSDFARLLDLLVNHFEYVVIDASSRMDRMVKLVCDLSDKVLLCAQPDVTSLWSATKMQDYLGDPFGGKRVCLIVNRFQKIPGLSDSDIENATKIKVIYHLPNNYNAVATSIERGVPLVNENNSEIARAFSGLAADIAERPTEHKTRKAFSLFGT